MYAIASHLIDSYLYYLGLLDTRLSFAELRQRSHIDKAARTAADGTGYFPGRIRMNRPGINQEKHYEVRL
jgi:hypothetical protein